MATSPHIAVGKVVQLHNDPLPPNLTVEAAAFAAQLNAGTVVAQQRAHHAEKSGLYAELQRLRKLITEREEVMLNSEVTLASGKVIDLFTLFEDAWTEQFQHCRRIEQEGGES